MGSFNTTGCISNLPIVWDNKIMVFLLHKNTDDTIDTKCYPSDKYSPLFIPFVSTYYDYGKPNIPESSNVIKTLEFIMGISINEIIEIFSERNLNSHRGRDYTNLLREDNVQNLCTYFKLYGSDLVEFFDKVFLSYEHYDYYMSLCENKLYLDNDNDSFIRFPQDEHELKSFVKHTMDMELDFKNKTIFKENCDLKIVWSATDNYRTDYYIYRNDKMVSKVDYSIISHIIKSWNGIADDCDKIKSPTDYYSAQLISKRDMILRYLLKIGYDIDENLFISNDEVKTMYDIVKILDSKELEDSKEEYINFFLSCKISNATDRVFIHEEVGHNFPSNSVRLLSNDILEDVVNFLYVLNNLSCHNLKFGSSEYANQSVDYDSLIKIYKNSIKLLTTLKQDYDDEE